MRSKLTFSNVVSCLALFVALGGTSYAAVKLAKNSVKAKHIAANAVSSPKIADGSLLGRDFRAGELPAGPRGPQGARGEKGDKGDSGIAPQPEAWKALPLGPGWNDYGSGWATAAFRKDQLGRVHLRGLVTRGPGVPAFGQVIGSLPEGYRPPAALLFVVATGETNAFGRVDVQPGGNIVWVAGGAGDPDFTSLSGISFWPD